MCEKVNLISSADTESTGTHVTETILVHPCLTKPLADHTQSKLSRDQGSSPDKNYSVSPKKTEKLSMFVVLSLSFRKAWSAAKAP